MSFSIEIAQSEDRYWRFRISEDTIWIGGFTSYTNAYEASVTALRNTAVAIIRSNLERKIATENCQIGG